MFTSLTCPLIYIHPPDCMPDHHGNAVNTLYSVSYEVIYTHPLHYQTQHRKAPDMESRVGSKLHQVDKALWETLHTFHGSFTMGQIHLNNMKL